MTDYSNAYRGVQYFGVAFEESADTYGRRDALAILATAAERTADRDLRHDRETLEALDFLIGQHLPAARAFQAALAIEHPTERRQAVTAAYRHLCRVVSGGIEIGL